ncbi:hypothetical protein R6Q59_004934 [Mikania micrantha]
MFKETNFEKISGERSCPEVGFSLESIFKTESPTDTHPTAGHRPHSQTRSEFVVLYSRNLRLSASPVVLPVSLLLRSSSPSLGFSGRPLRLSRGCYSDTKIATYRELSTSVRQHDIFLCMCVNLWFLWFGLINVGDVTCLATIPTEMEVEAYFLAKDDGIVAGIALAEMIFNEVDHFCCSKWNLVEWFKKDGDNVVRGLKFGKVHGRAHSIEVAERVVLNFMQRMSGIATLTKAMADAAHPACILETRKTAPALRLVDKWAVLIGGGQNHRMGLFDMVMIKDNHISIAGGVSNALKSVDLYLKKNNLQMGVEVETRTFEELHEVLNYASQNKTLLSRIMLDNMVVPQPDGDIDVSMLKQAVELINGKFETEASGNVTMETVHKIGQTGVTYISSGALTHSVKALDISLKIDTELALEVGRCTKRA